MGIAWQIQLANRSNYYPRTLRHLAKLLNLLRRDNAQSWEVQDIERKILDKVKEYKNIFPKDFERTFNWLNDRNVMANYKDIDFLERAFQGLAKNIRRGEILNLAITELKKNYKLFEAKSIEEFFYVKKENIKEFSKKIF